MTAAPDPRIAYLVEQLTRGRREVESAVAVVPEGLRRLSPGEGRWSIAQVLEHLGIVEGNITRVIGGLVAKAPERSAQEPYDAAAFGSHVDMPSLLDRTRRRQNSPASEPVAGLSTEAALEKLASTRLALLEALRQAEGKALDQVAQPHPSLGPITGYQWIAFVAYHESRHAAQIHEIGEQLAAGAA